MDIKDGNFNENNLESDFQESNQNLIDQQDATNEQDENQKITQTSQKFQISKILEQEISEKKQINFYRQILQQYTYFKAQQFQIQMDQTISQQLQVFSKSSNILNKVDSSKQQRLKLSNQNFVMILHFLPIGKILEFNLICKKFYNEIIPDFMFPQKKENHSYWNNLNGIKFDCSFRQRIVFMRNDNFYQIKELDDLFFEDKKKQQILFLNSRYIQHLFSITDLVMKLENLQKSQIASEFLQQITFGNNINSLYNFDLKMIQQNRYCLIIKGYFFFIELSFNFKANRYQIDDIFVFDGEREKHNIIIQQIDIFNSNRTKKQSFCISLNDQFQNKFNKRIFKSFHDGQYQLDQISFIQNLNIKDALKQLTLQIDENNFINVFQIDYARINIQLVCKNKENHNVQNIIFEQFTSIYNMHMLEPSLCFIDYFKNKLFVAINQKCDFEKTQKYYLIYNVEKDNDQKLVIDENFKKVEISYDDNGQTSKLLSKSIDFDGKFIIIKCLVLKDIYRQQKTILKESYISPDFQNFELHERIFDVQP